MRPENRISVVRSSAVRSQPVSRYSDSAARNAGIPIQIVPSVTAASLGRGLTERGVTDRLMMATAVCKPGDPEPDWAEMLRPGTSLAVYMGVSHAPMIVQSLQNASVPLSLEVEIVSKASTAEEKVTRCRLETLTKVLKDEHVANPAVIFIRWPKSVTTHQLMIA